MTKHSLWDQFKAYATSTFSDIREKVVEEGWFGRATAPPASMAVSLGWEQPEQPPVHLNVNLSVDASTTLITARPLSWEDLRAEARETAAQYPTLEHSPEHEHGIDR